MPTPFRHPPAARFMNESPDQEPTFEHAMARLEEIVASMESERMPLEEMVTSYEEGMNLLKVCRQRIENARRRVEMIVVDAEGKASLTAFAQGGAPQEDSTPERQTAAAAPAPVRRRAKPEASEESEDIRLF